MNFCTPINITARKILRMLIKKILIAAILLVLVFVFAEEKVYVTAEVGGSTEIVTTAAVKKNLPLTIKFIHSVQKTPVIEELEFDGADFVLRRTRYKSQGVGLPFMESDGVFRKDGDWFIMDNMNRRIKNLSLRTGVGTELTINLAGEEIKLYEKFPPGTKINVAIK